jgi:DNA-binding beta-propeller fold protein YncE
VFSGPLGVAVDANGNVFVADRLNNRIQKFTTAGTFLTKWGTVGSGDGQFANPVGVAVDRNLNVVWRVRRPRAFPRSP